MSLYLWGLYTSAVILPCLTPGPNSLLAVTNGVRFGARKTFFSTLDCGAGLTILIGAPRKNEHLSGFGRLYDHVNAT